MTKSAWQGRGQLSGRPAAPVPLRRPCAVVACCAAFVVVALGVVFFRGSGPSRVDLWIESVVEHELPQAPALRNLVDSVGAPRGVLVIVVALAGVCLLLRRPRLALVAVVGPGLTGVATTIVLKPVVGRTINGGYLAYPSGHTAAATALALVLALLVAGAVRAGGIAGTILVLGVAVAAGFVMAWSQITVNAHYPTDTIGGFCAALAIVPLSALLVDRVAGSRLGSGGIRR